MKDCIFCKIIRGEVPCMKVYEDEHSLVFMDIAGDLDGHMLAVPKQHCNNILDCEETALVNLLGAVQAVSRHCVEHCGYDGVNLLNASGEAAGQSVPHFHIHILPRKTGDGTDAWPQLPGGSASLGEMHEKLRMI